MRDMTVLVCGEEREGVVSSPSPADGVAEHTEGLQSVSLCGPTPVGKYNSKWGADALAQVRLQFNVLLWKTSLVHEIQPSRESRSMPWP